MQKWLLILVVLVAISAAATNTLDFSNDVVSNWVTATHPTTDFGTINLKYVEDINSTGTPQGSLTVETTGDIEGLGSTNDFHLLNSTKATYLVLYTDGREVNFSSVEFGSEGNTGNTVYSSLTAYAYRDGVLLGSQTIGAGGGTFPNDAASTTNGETVTFTDPIFQYVDEIRFTGASTHPIDGASTNDMVDSYFDDIVISDGVSPNTAPTIAIDASSLSYTEDAAATQIDGAATASDADGDSDWDGGTLTVQITANAEAADEISIPDNIVNTINTDGTNLRNSATVIGTLSASEGTVTNNTTLTITFNSNATNALVQDVVRAIHYRNTSDNPGTSNRTVTFTVTDVNAGTANDARTIAVTAADNDAPTMSTNNGLTLNEGATKAIPLDSLEADDVDDVNSTLTYTITSGPSNGQVENTDAAGTPITSFTQQNLIDGKIQYVHGDGNNTSDSFIFKVADDGSNELTGQTFNITVNAVDDDTPTISTNNGLSLNEGATKAIPLDSLEANDTDTDNSTLTYTITSGPSNGQVENTDSPGNAITSFTQQNLIDGKIQYVHGDGNNTSDSFIFKVADGTPNELTNQTFSITVVAVDDDTPTISTNNGLSLNEGATKAIPLDSLEANDTDTDNSTLTYTITTGPSNGQVENTDSPGNAITSFTQQNLIDGKIQYVHGDGNNTSDSFTFKVADGTPNELTGQTFSITVNAVDDDTPTIVSNKSLSLNEGATKLISIDSLEANDTDTDNSTLTYTITSGPSNGQVENTDSPGNAITSFTQQNLIDGKIQYVHDGSNTTSDVFTFKVADGTPNELTGQTFNFTIVDPATEPPTLTTPANSATDNNTLDIDFTLPEAASSGTVKMTFTRTGGTADANAPHVLTFAAGFETAAQHTTTLNGTDLSNNANVSSVNTDGSDALVDGAIYSVKLEYQDDVGNTAASVTNTNFAYDNATQTPTLTTPANNAIDNNALDIDFTLPEAASSGTVKMTFTQTGGTADVNSPHVITFAAGFETAAQHTTTLDGTDLSANANVSSVSSGVNDMLVDGAIYSVKLEYQDATGNTAASVTNTSFTYDNATQIPTLASPAVSSSDNSTLAVDFTLPEAASSGTVKMTFTRTGGTADANAPHVLTFAAGFETAAQHTSTLDGTDLSNNANVASVTTDGNDALVDGAVYSVKIEYQDATGNSAASVTNTAFTYDNVTAVPTLTTPATSSSDNSTLAIDFTLPEAASSGTVKMTFTRTGGTADANAPHVLTFAAGFETAAQHTTTLDGNDLSSDANVASVSTDGNDILVHNAIYSVKIEYQDDLGNAAASVTNTAFTYDNPNSAPALSIDNSTLAYTENDGATQIDAVSTVSDPDGDADWDGGNITLQITGNYESDDELNILNNVVGSINVLYPNIRDGSTVFGTLSFVPAAGGMGIKFTATLNSEATNARVQQLIRAVYYKSNSENPGTSDRTVTVTATDKNSNMASDTRTISVTRTNDAPTLSSVTSQAMPEDSLLTILPSMTNGADVDGDALAVVLGAGANFTVVGDTVKPNANINGVLQVPVAITDGTDTTAGLYMAITVTAVNDTPTVDMPMSDTTLIEDFNPINYRDLNSVFSDIEAGSALMFTAMTLQNKLDLIIKSSDSVLVLVAKKDVYGVDTVVVTAYDGTLSVKDSIIVTITSAEDAPSIITPIPDTTVIEDFATPINYRDLNDIFTDSDGDAITFSVASKAGKITPTINGADSMLVLTAVADAYGVDTLIVTAKDASDSTNDTVFVTISPVNDAPTMTAVSNQATVEDSLLTIVINMTNAADADDDILSIVLGSGSNYTVSGDTVKVVENFTGNLTVPVSVTDGIETTAPVNMNITVTPKNDAPFVLNSLPDTIVLEDFAQFIYRDLNTVFSDEESGTNLTYTVVSLTGKTLPTLQVSDSSLLIAPVTNANGSDIIAVTAMDEALSVSDTMVVTISPVNDAPTITSATAQSVAEEGMLTILLSMTDATDIDNVLTDAGVVVDAGTNYTVDGSTITPVKDFVGELTVPVRMKDGTDTSIAVNMSVTVTPVNDAPVMSTATTQTIAEDGALTILLSMTDATDIDNTLSDASLIVEAGNVYTVDGRTVTPFADYNGTMTVPIKVTDGEYTSSTVNMLVTVTPVNDAPTLSTVTAQTIAEDQPLKVLLSMTDAADIDDLLSNTSIVIDAGENYTVDGTTLTPAANFSGILTVPVKVTDGELTSATVNMSVTVTPENDTPTITTATTQTIVEEGSLTILLSMTDAADVDNTLTEESLIVEAGENYTLNGKTLTPAVNFNGTLSVPLKVTDGTTTSAPITMSVEVTPVNDAPTLTTVTAQTTAEDVPLAVTLSMTDAADVDNTLTDASIMIEAGSNYTVSGNTITPALNFSGVLTVPVKVTDGIETTAAVNMSLTVTAVNDAPTVTSATAQTIIENTSLTVTLDMVEGEADVDNSVLSIVIGAGENYTVSGTTLTPTAGYVGTLSVPIYVSDGELNSLPVTMTVTVLKENSAPVLEAVAPFVMQQDLAKMLSIADVTASDEDGDPLTLLIGAGANYTVSGTTITPAAGFVGTLSVPFSVTDGDKSSNVIMVSVTVKAANTNTAPVVAGASLNVEKDRSLTLTPTLVNATDADGDGLTLIITAGANYTVSGTTITPAADYVGLLSVPVQATDGIDTSVPATIPIAVYEKKIGFHIGQVIVSDTFTVTVVPNPVPPGENMLYITAPQEEFDELRVKIYSHTSDLVVEGDADVEWGTFIFTWDLSQGRAVRNGYSYVALLSFVKDGLVVKQDTKILGIAR